MAISLHTGLTISDTAMRSLPAKKLSKISLWDGRKTKIDNRQRCCCFITFQVHSPITVGPKRVSGTVNDGSYCYRCCLV